MQLLLWLRWWTPPRKFAALAFAVALGVAAPAWQAWRAWGLEFASADAARAAVATLGHAVATQRSLLAHRPLAAQVARGRLEFEPLREMRQQEVDEDLGLLGRSLASAHFDLAHIESQAMADDWATLVQRLDARDIDAQSSDYAHDLLVEQALLITDLIALAVSVNHQPPGAAAQPALAAVTATARLQVALARQQAAEAEGDPARLELAQRALQRRERALLEPLLAAAGSAGEPSLHRAVHAAHQALTLPDATSPAAAAAAQAALNDLAAVAVRDHGRFLERRVRQLEVDRRVLATTTLFLVLGLTTLFVAVTRRPTSEPAAAPGTDVVELRARPREVSAKTLFERLRRSPTQFEDTRE